MPDVRGERDAAATRRRHAYQSVRDIGPLPEADGLADRYERDLRGWCEYYQPEVYSLGWSPDHLRVIESIERAVLDGAQFALAMPRGSGKTSLCESAATWALLYGHRQFVMIVGADEAAAAAMLDSIRTELECNERLLASFPEVCHPIQKLEGNSKRCIGQTLEGERTHIGWAAKELILPTVPKAPGRRTAACGSILRVAGITGRIRGAKHKTSGGKQLRPDLVIVDDPQTDEVARSPVQVETREKVLSGAILGLSGPGKKIAALMPCTVIQRDDLADRMLNRALHPEWGGIRTQMVYDWPEEVELWNQYADIYRESFRKHGDFRLATAFYKKNREAMDRGARVGWESRYDPGELSAIQHAHNLRLRDPKAFAAEYQNAPLPPEDDGDQPIALTRSGIVARSEACGYPLVFERKEDGGDSIHVAQLPEEKIEFCTIGADVQRGGERAPGRVYWVMLGHSGSGADYILAWGTIYASPVGSQPTADQLHDALDRLKKLADARPFAGVDEWMTHGPPVVRVAVDVGDRQDDLVPWIRARRGWVPVKGETSARQAAQHGDIVGWVYPRRQKGGWTLYLIPSGIVRAEVHAGLSVEPLAAGSLNVPTGLRTQDALVRHLVATRQILDAKRGLRWTDKAKDREHHPEWQRRMDYLDALTYAKAVAVMWARTAASKRRRVYGHQPFKGGRR